MVGAGSRSTPCLNSLRNGHQTRRGLSTAVFGMEANLFHAGVINELQACWDQPTFFDLADQTGPSRFRVKVRPL